MGISIDIQDMGNDVSYLSVSAKSKEAGHVMVGRNHQVDVDVLSTNEPALALYDRLGFNETGRERDGKQVFIKMRRSTNI